MGGGDVLGTMVDGRLRSALPATGTSRLHMPSRSV